MRYIFPWLLMARWAIFSRFKVFPLTRTLEHLWWLLLGDENTKANSHYHQLSRNINFPESFTVYVPPDNNVCCGLLKAFLNRFNISSNVTKMPCWMKCWIDLTERKNSKNRKNPVGWRKIVLDENLMASKFFIQYFQAHSTQFSWWIGLLLVSSNI